MVKIPELAEDGQNWKFYCAKFLEVAATYDCLEVLAGRPYEGEDWDGCNALLCCTFMESVPPSIYFKIRCRTAHEILNTSRNDSATMNQFPMQMNSNMLGQPQWRKRQRTILRARTQPQNGMRTQIRMKMTYLPLKTSLEALKTLTTEMSDASLTHAQALKTWQRALAPSASR